MTETIGDFNNDKEKDNLNDFIKLLSEDEIHLDNLIKLLEKLFINNGSFLNFLREKFNDIQYYGIINKISVINGFNEIKNNKDIEEKFGNIEEKVKGHIKQLLELLK